MKREIKPRPKSVIGDRSSSNTRNSMITNQQRAATRRISLGSMNSNISLTSNSRILSSSPSSTKSIMSSSPTTSPIPRRRYSIQRSSSPAPSLRKSESNCSIQSATSTRASKYSIRQKPVSHNDSTTTTTTKKWLN
jgi:hypothetical protein